MPARKNDPPSDKVLQGCIDEVHSLTGVSALRNATAATRLSIILRLEEIEKAVVPLEVSAAKVHDREILLAELSLLQDRLATRTVPLDDMHDDEESPLLTLPKKSGDDGKRRRASRSHVLGFADSEARRYVKTCRGKDSRIHVRSQRTKTTAEAVLQQQNLTGNATRCVKNYADLLEVTQAAQFGTHQLLHQPPDILDMVVLSGGVVSPHTKETKRPIAEVPSPELVNIGRKPIVDKGMRQDQIILSSNLAIDEEQLKKDIQRELPNVCDVEIQYQEDVSATGSVSAVLVFSYSDPICQKSAKSDPLKDSRIEELTEPVKEMPSINAGKEGRSPKQEDSNEEGMYAKLANGTFTKVTPDPFEREKQVPEVVKTTRKESKQTAKAPAVKQSFIMGCTKVELMAYVVITMVFVVPMALFCCWVIKLFF